MFSLGYRFMVVPRAKVKKYTRKAPIMKIIKIQPLLFFQDFSNDYVRSLMM